MHYTPFTTSDSFSKGHELPEPIDCLVYIGLPNNPQFLGAQDPQALAEHIVRSRGPSGENKDYLYQLDEALKGLSDDSSDEHVHDLARRCRDVEGKGVDGAMKQSKDVIGSKLKKGNSTDEQEEVEEQ